MRVILGYGTYKGYSLKELPEGTLQELSRRFPLQADRYDHSDGTSLMVTVAIHEEIARRQLGGEKLKRIPTLKELASDLVTKGYHQLSKTHHPDRKGEPETQQRLNFVRQQLLEACNELADEIHDAIIIKEDEEDPVISDEDIPF